MIVLKENFQVPTELVTVEALEKYSKRIKVYEDVIDFKFYSEDEEGFVNFARGDLVRFQKLFKKIPISDQRAYPKATSELEFKWFLFDSQAEVVSRYLDYLDETPLAGGAIIEAPPRFGKTVVMAYLACHHKTKTLLLTHSIDLLRQALKTIYNATNCMEVEEKQGRQVAGIIKDLKDFDKDWDINLCTYQKFIKTRGIKWLSENKDKFGLIMVDECHKAAATKYSEVMAKFNSKLKVGVSGTPERMDGLHEVNYFLLGPVVAVGESEQVPVKVYVISTGLRIKALPPDSKVPNDFIRFLSCMNREIATSERRTKIAVQIANQWALAGHSVLILASQKKHIETLAYEIQKLGGVTVAAFYDKFKNPQERERCLEDVRTGKTKVVVANRSMTLGLDIPRLTVMINASATGNQKNFLQDFCRVRTPFAGKNEAYVFDLVDDHFIAVAFYRSRRKVYDQEEAVVVGDEFLQKKKKDKEDGFEKIKKRNFTSLL